MASPLTTTPRRSSCFSSFGAWVISLLFSSTFSLTNAMFFSCCRADERSCGLGGKTRAKSWQNVCLKRRKEDFREAMRLSSFYRRIKRHLFSLACVYFIDTHECFRIISCNVLSIEQFEFGAIER